MKLNVFEDIIHTLEKKIGLKEFKLRITAEHMCFACDDFIRPATANQICQTRLYCHTNLRSIFKAFI